MTGHVAVATDSSACLPSALAHAWGVRVAPLQIIVDDVAYDEGSGISPGDVVAALRAGSKVGTSQPGPMALAALIDDAQRDGASHLVFVTLSAELSGTAAAMRSIAATAAIPVTVVDTRTVTLAAGLAAVSAAALAARGAGPEEVAAEATRVARSALCLFTVESLEYLRRGGRISAATAALGTALGVRPVLQVEDGTVVQVERTRTSAKARAEVLARIAAAAAECASPVVGLMTVSGDDEIAGASASALAGMGSWPVVPARLSAALAAHGGPGSLVAVVADVHPDVVARLG